MRLLDFTLENYRVHRQLRVEFAPDLTLIGGPNEAGKSTLVEALHRVLFLRAKGTSEEHRAMRSHLATGGHPTATLRFSAEGQTWTLKKIFSGQSGTSSLSCPEELALNGESADTRLAQLLGVDGPAGGNRLALQWAHLWLWQGTSASDPTDPQTTPSAKLLGRLQSEAGGAALLSSPLDQGMLRHFSVGTDRYYNAHGKPTLNGPLGRAIAGLDSAKARSKTAHDRIGRYEGALRDFENSSARLTTLNSDLATIGREQADLKRKQDQLCSLRAQETSEGTEAERLERTHDDLQKIHGDVAVKQTALDAITVTLAPLLEREKQLVDKDLSAREAALAAEIQRESELAAVARAHGAHELLSAALASYNSALRLTELERRAEDRLTRTKEVERSRADLARLPVIDAKGLDRLKKLDRSRLESYAVLNSLSTGLDVLAAESPVRLGDRELKTGDSLEFTATTELHFGPGTRLRLRPGGGLSLVDARTSAEKAGQTLAKALGELALPDLDSAQSVLDQRRMAQDRLAAIERDLNTPDFARLDTELANARDTKSEAEGRLSRLRANQTGIDLPSDRETLAKAVAQADNDASDAQRRENNATSAFNAYRKKRDDAHEALRSHRDEIAAQRESEQELKAQLALLRQTHGEDVARAARLAAAAAASKSAAARLAQTRTAINDLQPELLDRDAIRLKRAGDKLAEERNAQSDRRIIAQAELRSDGSENPISDAADADAALARSEAEFAAIRQDGDAVRLVRDLYQDAQQALATRFTQPLVERTRDYVKCLFGENVSVTLEHTTDGFGGLSLSRAHGPAVPFAALSMGAREQLATTFRLAAAEFLAEEHEGSLPVVFDDAFAYADPERVRTLQGMLDLAATRGLQIIILSCNPADYATLGARAVSLSRAIPEGSPPSAPDANATQNVVDTPETAESLAETAASLAPTADLATLTARMLTILQRAHASVTPLVSSRALRQELDCEQIDFNAARDRLLTDGKIVVDGRSQRLASNQE